MTLHELIFGLRMSVSDPDLTEDHELLLRASALSQAYYRVKCSICPADHKHLATIRTTALSTMRVINTLTLQMHEFYDEQVPRYAILSHTWGNEEPKLQDFLKNVNGGKAGYAKIYNCCRRASSFNMK